MRNSQEIQILKGKKSKEKFDAIAFGSTYCRDSIDFGEYNGFNFGIGSQFFYYTDKMLREIAPKCLKKGGTVFLIIADLVFAEEGKGLYGQERYQLILSRRTLGEEFDYCTYFKVRFPLVCKPTLIKRVMGYCYHSLLGLSSRGITIPFTEEQVRHAAIERCNSWCRQFGLRDTKSSEIPCALEEKFKITRALLNGMIQFCIDSGFKPVLVVTPVSGIMNNELSDGFIDRVLYSNIRKSNVQNVLFLDYLRSSCFLDFINYDRSADLLRIESRRLFTQVLLRDSSLIE